MRYRVRSLAVLHTQAMRVLARMRTGCIIGCVAAHKRQVASNDDGVSLNEIPCRDQESMDFVVATIPTVMALEESARLVTQLRAERVPCSTIVVNQIVGENMGDKYLKMKLKEQRAAMEMLAGSPHLQPLNVIRGKLVDLEVRGVPALQYFATTLWAGMPAPAGGTGEGLVRAGARAQLCLSAHVASLATRTQLHARARHTRGCSAQQ